MKKPKYPIIALEGISYAGKTTLTELCKHNGMTILPETSEIVAYPKIPETLEQMHEVDKWFFDLHKIRYNEIINSAQTNTVIIDRYFLSDLAYIFARAKTYKIGETDSCYSLIKNGLNENKIIVPWIVYVSIDIDLHKSRKLINEELRIKKKGVTQVKRCPFEFNQTEFFKNQLKFYDQFFSINNKNVYIVDGSIEARLLYNRVFNWINGLPSVLPNQEFTLI